MTPKTDLALLGLGARSTAFYLNTLNDIALKRYGGYSTCPLTLVNTDFNTINPYLPDNFDKLIPVVTHYLSMLDGYQNIIIPNITLHEVIEKIAHLPKVHPFIINPIDQAVAQLKADNINEVLVVASRYTSSSKFLQKKLLQAGISVLPQNNQDVIDIDNLRRAVFSGNENVQEITQFNQYLASKACKSAILIACTELSIAYKSPLKNIYDTSLIQMQSAFL